MAAPAEARRRVVVIDPIDPAGLDDLRRDYEVIDFREIQEFERADAMKDADALVVRTTPVDADQLARMENVRVVVKHGAGVDNIDLAAAEARGVAVRSTPGVGAAAVAEHAVMLILMVCRRAVELHHKVRGGDFGVRDRWRLGELRGRRIGVVGLGNIGRYAADILHDGFGAEVLGFDPAQQGSDPQRPWLSLCTDLDELMRGSSVVTVHVPLTAATTGLLGRHELGLLADGGVVVNTSRGPLVDHDALVAELRSGRLSAGLDVFDREPLDPSDPLCSLDNVVLTPHIGGLTREAARNLSLACAAAVRAELGG